MKKIINKVIYNTEKSEFMASYDNGLGYLDQSHFYEGLYKTKNGTYFINGCGGLRTKYAESIWDRTSGLETIILISEDEAIEWLEKYNEIYVIESYFPDMIEIKDEYK